MSAEVKKEIQLEIAHVLFIVPPQSSRLEVAGGRLKAEDGNAFCEIDLGLAPQEMI